MGKLKAIRNNIIIKTYLHQKEELAIKGKNGETINLYIGSQYNTNYREKNPVMAEVLDNNSKYQYIKKGFMVIVHHNMVSNPETNPRCIEWDRQKGIAIFSIPCTYETTFCVIDENGEALPVCENVIAKRIDQVIKTKFIIIPDSVKKKESKMVDILKVSPEAKDKGIKVGSRILMYAYSDYEICYTFNKKEHSVIKIHMDEVLGEVK